MKNKDILTSVIVPIYNVENYLDRCVLSIANQTNKDIEIILVDDGSTDSSLSVAKKWEEKDSRIHVYSKENGGLSDARNYGLTKATGDYVCFIDSDDFILETYIEKLVNKIIEDECDIAVCDMEYLYDSGDKTYASGGDFTCDSVSNNPKLIGINNSACNKLYHMSMFDDVKFPKGKYYEDLFTVPILLFKANKVSKVNESLYVYYQRSGSIAHTANKKIFEIYEAINNCIEYVKKHGNNQQVIDELYHLYIIHGLDLTTIRIKDFDDSEIRVQYLRDNMELLNKYYPNYKSDVMYKNASIKKKLIYKLLESHKEKAVLKIYDK